MKKDKSFDIGVVVAIVFASIIISGSLVFFGMQMFGVSSPEANFDARVEKAIDNYVQKKQEEAQKQQAEVAKNQAEKSKEMAKNVPAVNKDEDHIYGNKDAKISIVEYSDFQCPYCERFHSTSKSIIDGYDGKVNLVFRYYPLPFHEPAATRQAIAAECIAELGGNDAFWKLADAMFEEKVAEETDLIASAKSFGIDESAFKDCLTTEKYTDNVKQEAESGSKSGVSGTPGNIILNNETGEAQLVEGAQPADVFKQIIDGM